jgi:predicted ATP-grasp superfamily ATP-dependent carboligase
LGKENPLRIFRKPEFQNSSLVVGWSEDAAKLGTKVMGYLKRKLGGQEFAEIEPEGFFPLGGVAVENDVAQFPESKFYFCQNQNLAILESNSPTGEWYKFLSSVLDVAEYYCQAKEVYTIGGMISVSAHTTPRRLIAITNLPQTKETLRHYDLIGNMDYETPPGQRPTLNAFLLWAAARRNIAGVSLWVPIPFYLVGTNDPQACRKTLEFLDQRLNLGLDFSELDEEIAKQNRRLAQARNQFSELDDYIRRLESNLNLTEEENEKLIKGIEEFLA